MKKFLHSRNNFQRSNSNWAAQLQKKLSGVVALVLVTLLFAYHGNAQTYTTQADGAWSSTTTWVGGQIPDATIGAGKTVNILHGVTYNLSADLVVTGNLNITGDTLRFPVLFNMKTIITATGVFKITNGGYLQNMPARLCQMDVNGGKVVFTNATVAVSKSIIATEGSRRKYLNSTVLVGELYEIDGKNVNPVIDTVQSSTIEVSVSGAGSFLIKNFVTLRVANVKIIVKDGDFSSNADGITVLPGAVSNMGFDVLNVKKDLENKGAWEARVDAYCVDGIIKGNNMAAIDFTRSEDCNPLASNNGTAPELTFINPILKSGQANKEGAVYRFSNVTTGVDAEIKLKKFSRNDIVMQNIDVADVGWDKAFQPQFGLPGVVAPWQNWYIDFEVIFYKAGTNTKQRMQKVDITALDVDGDGWSISEYAVFETPSNIIYSTVSYLTDQTTGLAGQSFTCSLDSLTSPLISCIVCGGDGKVGLWNLDECTACDGSGLVYTLCNHPFDGTNGNTVQGPIENFINIDTLATQVMATYQYVDKDRIRFRYGAKSAANSSNGSGLRLNSAWFRQFSMAPPQILPVKLTAFTATLNQQQVTINWTTSSEENFSHFVLQRSTDGLSYSDIAIIFGGATAYAYKDKNVTSASGVLYYRLKAVDETKEFTYSSIRMIRLGKETGTLTLSAFPNPARDNIRITLPANWQNKGVVLEIVSANGNRVQHLQIARASQTEQLQLTGLAKGAYIIKATSEAGTAQQMIIKN